MKKKLGTKLNLSRETLAVLDPDRMAEVRGNVRTFNGTCPADTCVTCHVASICEAC